MTEGLQTEDKRAPVVNALEASLGALGLVLIASWAAISAVAGGEPRDLLRWALASHLPPLVMLAAAVGIAAAYRPLVRLRINRASVLVFTAGAAIAGAGGGIWIGPTDHRVLSPGLSGEQALWWGVLWVGVAVPVIEELFFRGVLQAALARQVHIIIAVPLAALAFAIAHAGIPVFILWLSLGLAFGTLAAASRSVLPAIAAHAGWNLATVLYSHKMWLVHWMWPLLVIGFLVIMAALYMAIREVSEE